MAYNFTSSSSQFLEAPVASQTPVTMSCWFNRKQTNTVAIACAVTNKNGESFHLIQLTSGGGISINSRAQGQGGASIAASSNNIISPNVWGHVAGVISSSTSRIGYLNGTQVCINTSSSAPVGMDTVNVGCRYLLGVPGNFANDYLAEVGVWSVALSVDEISSLSKGISCNLIRPRSLIFYAPLVRDLIDIRGGSTIINVNTATVYAHPRIYY